MSATAQDSVRQSPVVEREGDEFRPIYNLYDVCGFSDLIYSGPSASEDEFSDSSDMDTTCSSNDLHTDTDAKEDTEVDEVFEAWDIGFYLSAVPSSDSEKKHCEEKKKLSMCESDDVREDDADDEFEEDEEEDVCELEEEVFYELEETSYHEEDYNEEEYNEEDHPEDPVHPEIPADPVDSEEYEVDSDSSYTFNTSIESAPEGEDDDNRRHPNDYDILKHNTWEAKAIMSGNVKVDPTRVDFLHEVNPLIPFEYVLYLKASTEKSAAVYLNAVRERKRLMWASEEDDQFEPSAKKLRIDDDDDDESNEIINVDV